MQPFSSYQGPGSGLLFYSSFLTGLCQPALSSPELCLLLAKTHAVHLSHVPHFPQAFSVTVKVLGFHLS